MALLAAVLMLAVGVGAVGVGSSLGPGRGEWERALPSSVGLSALKLNKAADKVMKNAPERYCLVVAKGGRLVHES
jgi:hypothetical protein